MFSGYDYFDSDEFHFWVGENGAEKLANRHGVARVRLRKLGSAAVETVLKSAGEHGVLKAMAQEPPSGERRHHHPHTGVTIVSCAYGDMRASADGVLVYGRDGLREIPVPVGTAFPDKSGVIAELYYCIVAGCEPPHDGR